ncbi:hypothetical protein VKT23_004551 [Stygiomarasmius scandens]|uniref:AB hydrolase-1 domain-containing protein n=1 Tax=Marasmiellus scandens TaxID=2682957 RepID=A0ABR1JX02_9AGAR
MARDLLLVINHLGWKDVALCGWSMGGVVVQQLLVLPFHPSNPTPLPFNVSHVFLASTRSVVLDKQHRLQQLSLKVAIGNGANQSTIRTPSERRAIAKGILQTAFDPAWLQMHAGRFETVLERWISEPRPLHVIAKQQRAVLTFDFENLLSMISPDIKTMVIHGELDQMIPFSAGTDICERIKTAQMIERGSDIGQVPSYTFGHQWFEYFDASVWVEVIDKFMRK